MSNTATYKVLIDAANSAKTLGELEKALSGINDEIKKVEPGSDAFNKLSKTAQTANSKIEKINETIQGIKLEDKLEAMDGALKVVAGSTQAVVGSLGLLGIESEKFKKFEESAASAIAFGMGIKDLSEGIGKLAKSQAAATAATKVATVVQKGFNAVMSMNPVGILILSLTTAAGLIIAFKDKILDFIKTALGPFAGIIDTIAEGFRTLGAAVGLVDDAQTAATKNRIKQLEQQIKLEEAAGKSSLDLQKNLAAEKRKLLEKGSEEYETSLNEEAVLDAKIKKEKEDKEKEHQDKLKEKRKKASEAEKTRLEAYKTLLKKYQDEEQDIVAETEQQKLDLEKQRGLQEINALKLTQDEKIKLIEQFNKVYELKQEELNKVLKEQADAKKLEDTQRETDLQLELQTLRASKTETLLDDAEAEIQLTTEKYKRLIDEAIKNNQDITTLEALKEEELSKIKTDAQLAEDERLNGIKEKQYQDLMENIQNEFDAAQDKIAIRAMVVDAISQIADQESAVGKAAFIAQQILRLQDLKATATAALQKLAIDQGKAGASTAAGFAETAKVGFPQNVPLLIGYAAQAAAIISTMTKAFGQAKQAAGGVGGGGGPAMSAPSVSVPQTPTAVSPFAQQLQANQATQQGNEPLKAYVLSGDVRSSSEADAKIRMRRTVGS
jgi:hypothetical protein